MAERWATLVDAFDRLFPEGSPRRKAMHIVAIVLLVEGLSVFVLFSYVGLPIGLVSFLIGVIVLALLHRKDEAEVEEAVTPGIRFIDASVRFLGGGPVMMVMGAAIIVLVVFYNFKVSPRPEMGDLDTLTVLLGAILIVYPVLPDRYRVESSFALIFIGFVVLILVVPQAVMSVGGSDGDSSIGNWYVHYMLAAPFAGILDLIGIPARSLADLVTIQFQDGSVHTLMISAYCAGLYSFSIFISAFVAFVFVFERLPRRTVAWVLALGLFVAYLGNLIRMVAIGVVGYYRGLDALFWAHENVGWMIFLAWSAVFWWLILGRVSRIGGRTVQQTASDK